MYLKPESISSPNDRNDLIATLEIIRSLGDAVFYSYLESTIPYLVAIQNQEIDAAEKLKIHLDATTVESVYTNFRSKLDDRSSL